MIKSPYATKFTRMQQEGKPNPERDMTNKKAQQQPIRKARWESKNSKQS